MDCGLVGLVGRDEVFIPLAAEEFTRLKEARSSLLEYVAIEEKYDVLIENYLEFEMSILEFAAKSMVLGSATWNYESFHVARTTLDRRLANLLSACQMYEDHVKQHVHRALPGKETPLANWFADEYEHKFGYRCMDALRNHVQHSGMPIHRVTANMQWTSLDEKGMLACGFTPHVEARFLEANPKFKKPILREIEALGGKLDLKPLLREYVEGFSVIHAKTRDLLDQKSPRWESELEQAIARFQAGSTPDTGLWWVRAVCEIEGQQSEEFEVFTELADRRRHLRKKNEAPQTSLTRRFATNEVFTQGGNSRSAT